MRIGAWGVPFVGLFLIISLFRKDWTTRLFMAPAAGFTILYAGFYTLAAFEIGPRYYLPMVLLAIIPATGGALFVRDLFKRKNVPGSRTFIAALVFTTLIFLTAGVWPRMAASVRAQMAVVSAAPEGPRGPSGRDAVADLPQGPSLSEEHLPHPQFLAIPGPGAHLCSLPDAGGEQESPGDVPAKTCLCHRRRPKHAHDVLRAVRGQRGEFRELSSPPG